MREAASNLGMKALALAVLLVAAWVLFQFVLGFLTWLAWVALAIAAVIAVGVVGLARGCSYASEEPNYENNANGVRNAPDA